VALDVARIGFCQRATCPSPSWVKATDIHIAAYKETLHTRLKDTMLPYSAFCVKACVAHTMSILIVSTYMQVRLQLLACLKQMILFHFLVAVALVVVSLGGQTSSIL